MSKINRKHFVELEQTSMQTSKEFVRFLQHFNNVMRLMEDRVEKLEEIIGNMQGAQHDNQKT